MSREHRTGVWKSLGVLWTRLALGLERLKRPHWGGVLEFLRVKSIAIFFASRYFLYKQVVDSGNPLCRKPYV